MAQKEVPIAGGGSSMEEGSASTSKPLNGPGKGINAKRMTKNGRPTEEAQLKEGRVPPWRKVAQSGNRSRLITLDIYIYISIYIYIYIFTTSLYPSNRATPISPTFAFP